MRLYAQRRWVAEMPERHTEGEYVGRDERAAGIDARGFAKPTPRWACQLFPIAFCQLGRALTRFHHATTLGYFAMTSLAGVVSRYSM